MSNITLEQIDIVMQRMNVSFAEAKEALEHCDGDVIEAILYLETIDKVQATKSTSSNSDKLAGVIDKLNATAFIMKKGDRTYVDVSLTVALIVIICTFHVSVVAIIIALLFGVRINIAGQNDIANKINSTIDDLKKH